MQTYKYYRNGKLHRDDGPAVIKPDGTQEWYKEGKLHRDDGPAVIYTFGEEQWYNNGEIHKNSKQLSNLSKNIQEFRSEKIICKL